MNAAADIAAHTAHAAEITAKTLARPLPEGACYAVRNVYGQRAGFMPLVDSDGDVLTDRSKAKATIEALALAHAASIVSPHLTFVHVTVAREWLAA